MGLGGGKSDLLLGLAGPNGEKANGLAFFQDPSIETTTTVTAPDGTVTVTVAEVASGRRVQEHVVAPLAGASIPLLEQAGRAALQRELAAQAARDAGGLTFEE